MSPSLQIILAVVVIILLFLIFGRNRARDIRAKQAAKSYCRQHDLLFKKVKVFPKHYGLYFRKAAKSYYANFNFDAKEGIVWKSGTPLDKINA
ncbi:hypothetical protein [Flavobacterium sp. 3HN19-14]|uniref:hypothetical protein n=1 Tax=Flavobacterium sp. 3HN19-14 TaxID=3448133 RepID=UPI003EDFD54E